MPERELIQIAELHGIRDITPDGLLFGPGKGYFNINLAKLLDPAELDPVNAALVGAVVMGATRGGFSFAVEPEMRQIEVDGQRGPQMGLNRKDSETATITVNFAEQTIANILRMVPGAIRNDVGNGLVQITGGELNDESYISNVCFLATHGVGGRAYPAIIVIENALADEGFELSLEDKDEAVPEVTFKAHYNTATADTAPWAVYLAPLPGEVAPA